MRDLTLRSILIASDLSESSDDVVRGAAAVAVATGAELHVMSVVEPRAPYPGAAEPVLEMQRRIHDARAALDEQIGRTVPAGLAVASRHAGYSAPFLAIRDRAVEVAADLLVIGPHRPRPFGSRLLGKTADRLVRQVDVPCLILRAPLPTPLGRVLVATDLSPASQPALDVAIEWAGALRGVPGAEARLRVLHVAPWFLGGESMPDERSTTGELLRNEVDDAVERAGGGLPVGVECEVVWGEAPPENILQAAVAWPAELLVVGTHGSGALARALIGSVSSTVARDAECAVLLVPPGVERPAVFVVEEMTGDADTAPNTLSPAARSWQ